MSIKIEVEKGGPTATNEKIDAKERINKLYDYLVPYCKENGLRICGCILAEEKQKEILGIKMPSSNTPIAGSVIRVNSSMKDVIYSLERMSKKALREVLDAEEKSNEEL